MKDKIVFLFGAGISLPACMPSTSDITQVILSGEDQKNKRNVDRDGDRRYFLGNGNPNEYMKQKINSIRIFLEYISTFIRPHFDRDINYEDIFYCVDQIVSNKPPIYEYENPLIDPFITNAIPIIESKCGVNLYAIANEAGDYIRGIITSLLSGSENKSINHLNFLKEAHSEFSIDVFTLNHDLLLDTFFQESGLIVVDGFEAENNTISAWNPELFNMSKGIKYIKLHGSVNWFEFRKNEKNISNQFRLKRIFKIPSNNTKIYGFLDKNGNELTPEPCPPEPLILVGLFNKMLLYIQRIYTRLQYEWYKSLLESNRLIVSGYSFGDKGINTRIIDWLYENSDNRLIILHNNPEDLRKSARQAINNNWDYLIKEGSMRIVERNIDKDLSWKEIACII